jgi:hypothetical protein
MSETTVRRVLYVAKTHLDVGFTDTAAAVRRRYLDDFFPRAVAVAAELRGRGGPARLRWTTGSWILTEALGAADRTTRSQLEVAVEAGDLCWHALPFTMHTEYADRSLVAHGLTLSAELDRRFGRHTRAAKATDVPGHTRGLVSLLAEAGVDLLHVGVNPVAAVPDVPLQFRWRDPAAPNRLGAPAPEISVMYQPGGYGDVQVVAGTDVAVAIDLTGDNLGPRSADEVVAAFEALGARFPGAEVVAATLDDVAEAMAGAGDALPLLDAEIGDTWIHGVGSDPVKTAGFRELSRRRRSWIDSGRIDPDDPGLARASTRLLLVAEHTWGMDQKTHWPDTEHWSAAALAEVRDRPDTVRFEASWAEQRALLDEFVDTLDAAGHAELAQEASTAWAAARRLEPPVVDDDWSRLDTGATAALGPWQVTVDHRGSVVGFVGPDGRDWADHDRPLFEVHQQTLDAGDYERWYSTYTSSVRPEDEGWARWDNTKPGLEHVGARSATWPTELDRWWSCRLDGAAAVVIDQRVRCVDDDPVAAPERYRTTLCWDAEAGRLTATLSWWDRPAARWPGVTWWRVAPAVADASAWSMTKLGESVSPSEVVDGGGRFLHVAERLVHPEGVLVELTDCGLVCPGAPRPLVWEPQRQVDLSDGWHVCVLSNLWGTNFPMWSDGDGRCRIELSLPGADDGPT